MKLFNRGGEGNIVSPSEAKESLGRTSFRRVGSDHTGNRSDETAWKAEGKIDRELAQKQRDAEIAAEFDNYVPPQSRR